MKYRQISVNSQYFLITSFDTDQQFLIEHWIAQVATIE